MDADDFAKVQAEFAKTDFPGLCDRANSDCSPDTLATKKWSQATGKGEEIYLYCDFHAPTNATNYPPDPLREENLEDTVEGLRGPGLAKLRSRLGGGSGRRLQSTGDAASDAVSLAKFVIFQTLDASPENPILVEFHQHILDPFTGPGQFDLVERDSVRRVFDGASAGGTAVLTSATMNWQPGDAGQSIKVGLNPGRHYTILSRQSSTQVTLNGLIAQPSAELTLTMDGHEDSEVTIATKSGFPGVTPVGGWSPFSKPLTSDKVYFVVFVPGTTGDGIYAMTRARELYPITITPEVQ